MKWGRIGFSAYGTGIVGTTEVSGLHSAAILLSFLCLWGRVPFAGPCSAPGIEPGFLALISRPRFNLQSIKIMEDAEGQLFRAVCNKLIGTVFIFSQT